MIEPEAAPEQIHETAPVIGACGMDGHSLEDLDADHVLRRHRASYVVAAIPDAEPPLSCPGLRLGRGSIAGAIALRADALLQRPRGSPQTREARGLREGSSVSSTFVQHSKGPRGTQVLRSTCALPPVIARVDQGVG